MKAPAASRGFSLSWAPDGALRVATPWPLSRTALRELELEGIRVRREGATPCEPADLELGPSRRGREPHDAAARLGRVTRKAWGRRQLVGGVLVGGQSRRMGTDKALLRAGSRRWVDRQVRLLAEICAPVFLLGRTIEPWSGLPDHDGSGPLAGALALARACPGTTLVVVAVDQPELGPAGLRWLLRRRRPGRDVVAGVVEGVAQPLPLIIEPQAFQALAELVATGAGPRALLELPGAAVVAIPRRLAGGWRDFDSPSQIAQARHRGLGASATIAENV